MWKSSIVAATLVLLVSAAPTSAATVSGGWQARLGTKGANGTFTVNVYTTGNAQVLVRLKGMARSQQIDVQVRAGSCTRPGRLVLAWRYWTTKSGTVSATAKLTASQVRALSATGRVLTAASRCAPLKAFSRPQPTLTPPTSSSYFLPAPSGQELIVTNGNLDAYDHAPGQQGQYAFDFGVAGDAPFTVVAARAGRVIGVRSDSSVQCSGANAPYTNCWADANFVLIDHGDGTSGLYMHLAPNQVLVHQGDQVCQGQPLGTDGHTGWANANHLHFQVQGTPLTREGVGWWWGTSMPFRFLDPDVTRQRSDGVPVRGTYVSANAQTCGPATAPAITSVDVTWLPNQNASFTIHGSGFGSAYPFDGDWSYIQIADLPGNWSAGYSGTGDAVNVNVTGWNDTTITVANLSGAYNQNGWTLHAGDSMQARIWNPQSGSGPARFSFTMPAPPATAPAITSVCVTWFFQGVGTIGPGAGFRVDGAGFGTHAPYDGVSTYLQIADLTGGWGAGFQDAGGQDAVHVHVTTWNDNAILLYLTGAYGQNGWIVHPWDRMQAREWNPQTGTGPATFDFTMPDYATCPQ